MATMKKAKKTAKPFAKRCAGILLHPSSLPNADFGPDAYHFIDFLSSAGFSLWQVLPLNPPDAENSPYIARAALALHTEFLSPHVLREWGWLTETDPQHGDAMLHAVRTGFAANAHDGDAERYQQFLTSNAAWLDDYALFEAIKAAQSDKSWQQWPKALRDRDSKALAKAADDHIEHIDDIKFGQFAIDRQWRALRDYAHSRDVKLFGDVPIFVALDSVDVWANRDNFLLDKTGMPTVVAGVPPDYFSKTGQRWGNPLYNWPKMEEQGFRWWLSRLQRQLDLFDIVRIDHFRGFEAYWEIDASEESAINGRWVKAPGDALFKTLKKELGAIPLVAEDLGLITKEVHQLRKRYKLPGMRILQFGFDGKPDNPYLPHNYEHDTVVYSGTHDNDTTFGWYHSLDEGGKQLVNHYLGCDGESMPWPVIRAALSCVAQLAVIPMQDLLALGTDARMNVPGVMKGNWVWKFDWHQVPDDLAAKLHEMNRCYGRLL